jgi:hypothetical protein
MILVSHRGNISGPNPENENHPDYITEALSRGFDVEVDVWGDKELWLGHDKPQYKCPTSFLINNYQKLWIHCKNLAAIDILSEFKVLNYFWHQNDDFTLTSKNFIWTYPGKYVCNKSVLVIDDAREYAGPICFGLCSDYLK